MYIAQLNINKLKYEEFKDQLQNSLLLAFYTIQLLDLPTLRSCRDKAKIIKLFISIDITLLAYNLRPILRDPHAWSPSEMHSYNYQTLMHAYI